VLVPKAWNWFTLMQMNVIGCPLFELIVATMLLPPTLFW
jgi:hypothetical protein